MGNIARQDESMAPIELTEEDLALREIAKKYGLHIADVEKLHREFNKIDVDRSGSLEKSEFEKVYRALTNLPAEVEIPRRRIDELIDEVDADDSGTVDFEEYLMICVELSVVQAKARVQEFL